MTMKKLLIVAVLASLVLLPPVMAERTAAAGTRTTVERVPAAPVKSATATRRTPTRYYFTLQ